MSKDKSVDLFVMPIGILELLDVFIFRLGETRALSAHSVFLRASLLPCLKSEAPKPNLRTQQTASPPLPRPQDGDGIQGADVPPLQGRRGHEQGEVLSFAGGKG